MKKLILTLIITAFIVACKKDSTSTPATPAPAVTPTSAPTQDANLIGVWVQDSSLIVGQTTIKDSTFPFGWHTYDTLYITTTEYRETSWFYSNQYTPPYAPGTPNVYLPTTWQTLGDSLFMNFSFAAIWHFQYTINGKHLFIYEGNAWIYEGQYGPIEVNQSPNNAQSKYWYHKIR